ncbi:VOC family protein, partial [Glycomyces tenuis]|uniref:VOC family protein n=1 Tax=Glycomyces tenuis TaxID=58116 RepID=UPI000692526A
MYKRQGNTHADFPRGFVELVALAPERRERLPDEARLVPLAIPDERLAATRAAMRRTVAGLAARLDRSEGAHILVFAADDAERTAARLRAAGVEHGGARPAQRPITTAAGTELAAIKYLELGDAASDGMLPEGRIGVAEDAPPELLDAQTGLDHPNGALALAECVLCVGEGELESTAERYERLLGTAARGDGDSRAFTLGSGRLTVTTSAGLAARLPGERARTVPALSAYAVDVADLAAAERLLRGAGVE